MVMKQSYRLSLSNNTDILIRLTTQVTLLGVSWKSSYTVNDTTNDTPTESESFNVTTNVKSVCITKPTMSQKDVGDELAIS